MKITYKNTFIAIMAIVILAGCASKKRKNDDNPSVLNKFYHNTTAYYNGYFNANELLEETYLQLEAAHNDDYTEIISVYNYDKVPDPKIINADMDKAIEKVVKVAALHENSDWVDDCYVLMGEAQYVKQEYETAEETLLYFQEDFNPANPNGRNYKNKGLTKKEKTKIKEKERKESKISKQNEKKAREEEREAKTKLKEEERKLKEKTKKAERKAKEKEREAKAKERKKARKKGKNSRKTRKTKTRPVKEEEVVPETKEKSNEEEIIEKITSEKAEPIDKPIKEDRKEEVIEEKEEYDLEAELKKKKKEEEKQKNKKTAYAKGQLLLARNYVARGNYSSSTYLLDKLESEGPSTDISREIPVIRADIYIKEKKYSLAITSLKKAIERTNKKSLKSRYAFIIGQIYTLEKNYEGASTYFTDAKKWSKDFNLEFASELNMEKNLMLSGKKSKEEVDTKLSKMLKEDKYIEQRDQIYFIQGEMHYEDDNHERAVESFTKSIANNTSNLPLKEEAYYRLATLKYDQENYISAKNYYDSTLLVINQKNKKYSEVKNMSNNLKDIVSNIEIIELNDSLINLTKLSDSELRKIATANLIKNEIEASSLKSEKVNGVREIKKDGFFSSTSQVFGKSDFPFYNPTIRERGKTIFDKKWGADRSLVDNWRRKASISNIDNSITETTTDSESATTQEDLENEIDAELRQLKSNIPYSGDKKTQVNSTLEIAYYALGTLYRSNINNYTNSAKTLEKFVSKFPKSAHLLDAYYYLYLDYQNLGNNAKVTYYKNKIKNDFPESNFAKVIDNPSFADNIREDENKLKTYYEETYTLFQEGNYKEVQERAAVAETLFGVENDLSLKFELLKTMALGSTSGRESYIAGLKNYIQKYPNTDEQTKAKELLRLLLGDDNFGGLDIKSETQQYNLEPDELHYIIVILNDIDSKTVTQAKISINKYNKKYYKSKRFKLGDVVLNREDKTELIFLRRFDNQEDVMKYYNSALKSTEEYVGSVTKNYSIYAISQANYRLLVQEKKEDTYKAFFKENYLK